MGVPNSSKIGTRVQFDRRNKIGRVPTRSPAGFSPGQKPNCTKIGTQTQFDMGYNIGQVPHRVHTGFPPGSHWLRGQIPQKFAHMAQFVMGYNIAGFLLGQHRLDSDPVTHQDPAGFPLGQRHMLVKGMQQVLVKQLLVLVMEWEVGVGKG